MTNFKNISKSILSKILFAFLLLSFVLFGISSFLLQDSGNWIAKIDGKKITYQKLEKSVNIERKIILSKNPNNKIAVDYVNSPKFKIDVLGKIINEKMIETISNRYGIYPDRMEILTNITKNTNFHRNGKFDHKLLKSILTDNGLTEDDYIKMISNETINTMIVNSLSLVSPIDKEITSKITNMEEQTRYADLITISPNNIRNKIKPPTQAQLQIIYETNISDFQVPQKREIQYITFDRSILTRGSFVTNKQVKEFYETNKERFKTDQTRDFYHVAFNDRIDAEEFLKQLEASSDDKEKTFIKLGKTLAKKSQRQLLVKDITVNDSIPEVAQEVFQLNQGQNSKIFESDLGYHIVLTKAIKAGKFLEFNAVKKEIKKQLTEKLHRETIESKINQINETLLSSNSLTEAAKKFRLGYIKTVKDFTYNKPEKESYRSKQARKIEDFAKNAFGFEKDKVSTLIETKNQEIYAILVKNITEARTESFSEVQTSLRKTYYQKQKDEQQLNLAKEVLQEVTQNPNKAYKIARKYGLRLNRNKSFTKTKKIKIQGKEYQTSTKFLNDLFNLKINQVTNYHQDEDGKSYKIAILKKVTTPKLSFEQINKHRTNLSESYRRGFIESFNRYIEEEHEVKINNKFIASLQNQQPNQE